MKKNWPLRDECCPGPFWSVTATRWLSSSHSTLPDHALMLHNAAVPWCIRKPLCLAGPPPLSPWCCIPPMTVGIRHAPSIQAMYHLSVLCRLGTRGAYRLFLSSYQGSVLHRYSSPLRLENREIAGDMNVGSKQIILLALSHGFSSD